MTQSNGKQYGPWRLGHPRILGEQRCILGEGPIWHEATSSVYWVDIKGMNVLRYHPAKNVTESWPIGEQVSFILPFSSADTFILGLQSGICIARLGVPGTAPSIERKAVLEPNLPNNRLNDAKRAPDGSIWVGSMDDRETGLASGNWWRVDQGFNHKLLETDQIITNGPAFDVAGSCVYFTDSARGQVYRARLLNNGSGFAEKEIFLTFSGSEGAPDGMQVDEDGCLWIAFWGGAALRRFDRAGNLVQTVDLPVSFPTSLTFNLDQSAIYVTSAIGSAQETGLGHLDGRLLHMDRLL